MGTNVWLLVFLVTALVTVCTSSPCDSTPCENGGFCHAFEGQYQCYCTAGFTGTHCETSITGPCDSSPCQNQGTCNVVGARYLCTCPAGFTGTRCEIITGPCVSSPCLNQGTCNVVGAGYECNCPAGFTGTRCEIVSCGSSPCWNQGFCVVTEAGYECNCPIGFTGTRCEIITDIGSIYLESYETAIISSPGYPTSNYPNNANQVWNVKTSDGRILRLTFETFNTEYYYDYLDVGDGTDLGSYLLVRLYGTQLIVPPDVLSSGRTMWIRLKSDASVTKSGFRAVISSVSSSEGTKGRYIDNNEEPTGKDVFKL